MARGHATARPMMSTRVSGRSVGSVRGVRATHRIVTFTRSPYRTVAEEKGTVVGRRVVFQLQAVSDGVPGEEWFLDGNLWQRVHRQVAGRPACGERSRSVARRRSGEFDAGCTIPRTPPSGSTATRRPVWGARPARVGESGVGDSSKVNVFRQLTVMRSRCG